jgi:hypothetical protein
MDGAWRQWVGASGITVLLLTLGFGTIYLQHWPQWTVLVPPAVIVVAILLWLGRPGGADTATAFVRGDASHSSFEDVRATADTFIAGDARYAIFRNVRFNVRGRFWPWLALIVAMLAVSAVGWSAYGRT